MIIEHCSTAHQDARGRIIDLLRDTPVEFTTLITSRAGAVRGNHYHKEATVYVFVLEGTFDIYSRLMGEDVSDMMATAGVGDLITFPPLDLHALVALEDSVFILFSHGKRGGDRTVAECLYDPGVLTSNRPN